MRPDAPCPLDEIDVPETFRAQWQSVVNVMAELLHVPAGLIMRVVGPEIRVLVRSDTEGNPYHEGDAEEVWGSGLYCETVIKQDAQLLVPDALQDPDWRDNPDVKLNMISYLGFPIRWPDGSRFGTLCVLDSKANAYDATKQRLLETLRGVIEGDLQLVHAARRLGKPAARLDEIVDEVEALRGLVPICCMCKSVRDDDGFWASVEEYVTKVSGGQLTHSYCPDCLERQLERISDEI